MELSSFTDMQSYQRDKAMAWWNKQRDIFKQSLTNDCFPQRSWKTLTGREIESIYNHSPIIAQRELLTALEYLLSSYKADFENITGAELNKTEAVKKAEAAIAKYSKP